MILQPVTGGLLMMLSAMPITERWLLASLGLYAFAGLFWVPVIFMQIEMRDLARNGGRSSAAAAAALFRAVPPLVPVRLSRLRFGHGDPLADDRKTVLGDAMNRRATILVLGASGLIGRFVTDDLRARGFAVIGVARSLVAVAEDRARTISNCRSCRWMQPR